MAGGGGKRTNTFHELRRYRGGGKEVQGWGGGKDSARCKIGSRDTT